MYMSYFTIIPVILYLLVILALTVAAVRLIWIAGSYLKSKQRQLPDGPASQT